ncbi:iron complex transport system substrate-binding protein [Paenibacillus castaneae]|uniref:siderophore ABC transporter substrate-binding protein n=1 Tax=Paenibacillus castaneae TaxID=474957 RepID=UPI000C9A3CBC|nr:siderophore ABC transporter substrate-binding protein [Paenibacillus castaneae]NIK79619.1 iron complex transport system substrate-binding protein [Paenibacillus castaneae]
MKKSLPVVAILVIFAMVIAACGANNGGNKPASGATNAPQTEAPAGSETPALTEVTVKHQLGETVVPVNPSKVVVFDYGVLDTLDKLGVEVAAVSQASLPTYLEKYKDAKYVNAGALKEPDFEKINDIAPDLIIISGRQADSYDELSKIAPTIHMGVDTKNYMESFTNNVKTLGQIFGKEAEVETELASINDSIKTLNDKATASGKNGLIILANEGAISAYGEASRFGIIHDVFGVQAVDKGIEVSTHGQPVTYEYVAEKDADYLFVVDRNAVVAGEGDAHSSVENALVKNTKAFKEGNIVYLEPEYWYLSGGGLMSVAAMVKEIDAAIK